MKKIIAAILFLSIAACSAAETSVKKPEENKAQNQINAPDSTDIKNAASDYVVDGALAEMQGNYAEAILDYQEALKLDPSPGLHYTIAKSYLKLKKIGPAMRHAQTAVAGDSTDTEYLTLLGHIFFISNKVDSAQAIFEKVVRLDSTDYNAYYNLGALYERGKPLKALEVYNKLLKLAGPQWSVLVKIAELNERLGNVKKTIATIENLAKLDPSNLKLQELLIESYVKVGDYDKAIKLLDDVLLLYPDNPHLIEMKAQTYIAEKKWEEGAKEYIKIIHNEKIPFETKVEISAGFAKEAMNDSALIPAAEMVLTEIDKDSTDWQVNSLLGEIYRIDGKDSLSIERFEKAASLAEWNSQVWSSLGIGLFEAGRYEEAVEQMTKGLKNFPNDFVLNFVMGFSQSQLGAHKEAKKYLEKATLLNPNDVNVLSVYAFTLNQLHEEDEALKYIKKSLSIDPNNAQLLGMAGMIYDGKKMWTECDSSYQKAIKLDSANVLLLNNYAYSLAERGIKLDEALKMVSYSVEKEPENSSYLDTMGWVYFKLGEYDKAEKYIGKALDVDGANAVILEHLGDVKFKKGEKDKALELWKDAYALDKSNEKLKEKIDKKAIE
ncbi:MAG: tetratricopeptide repeat protein [Chlorobi bacterium]|nr:tetratricopeptide repeat protein [Chlorobiota bacterium]